jgi:hypothetical protein
MAFPAAPFQEAAAEWEGYMDATYFQEGDRVRSRVTRRYIKAGMIGTVRRLFLSVDHTYDVVFDRNNPPVAMRGYELERIEQAQEVGS